MTRTSLMGLLPAAILAALATPSFSEALPSNPVPHARPLVRVMAQDGRPDGEAASVLLAQADFNRQGPEAGPSDESGPPHIAHAPFGPELRLAASLAAAETYVGITSAQLDAWRAYSVALIDLVEPPKPDHGAGEPRGERPDGARGERPDGPPTADGSQPSDGPLLAEHLADQAIERGEKANSLKTALAALRGVLAPEQIMKLRASERFLLPPPGPVGSDGHGFDRTDGHPGWHDDVPPPPFPWAPGE